MYEGTKRQSAPERRGHVGDGHVPVTGAVRSAPLLQSRDGSHNDANTAESELLLDAQDEAGGVKREAGSAPELRSAAASCFLAEGPGRTGGGGGGGGRRYRSSPTEKELPEPRKHTPEGLKKRNK